jgi:hypothetical protein
MAYLYPRLETGWLLSFDTGWHLGLELIGNMAASPIGFACTFNISALTLLYQRDIVTSIVSVHIGKHWTCDPQRGHRI